MLLYVKMLCLRQFGTSVLRCANILAFVPKHNPVCSSDIERVTHFVKHSEHLLIVTGAGISTESGIPDYRSEGVGLYARSTNKPIQYQEFVKNSNARKRYWARNFVGWPRFSSFQPNATHIALCDLELKHHRVSCIVTQNVDRLHGKAGSHNVIELHGTTYEVMCLSCDNIIPRHEFQKVLEELNPSVQIQSTMIRPDGDVELTEDQMEHFQVPPCSNCGGMLKPNIVFFGDNVPRDRVEAVKHEVATCDTVMVLGSTLTVFSSYRIILQAKELDKRIGIINIGPTRGDKHAHLKVDAKCGDIIPKLIL